MRWWKGKEDDKEGGTELKKYNLTGFYVSYPVYEKK